MSTTEKPKSDQGVESIVQKQEDVQIEEASEFSQDYLDPPDGGLKAWLVVLGAFCVSLCLFRVISYCKY